MDELVNKIDERYQKVRIEFINNVILSVILFVSFVVLLYFYLTNEINYYILTVLGTIGVILLLVLYFMISSLKEIHFLKKVKQNPEQYQSFFQEERPAYLDNVLPEGKSYPEVRNYGFSGKGRQKKEEEYLKKIEDLEKEIQHLKTMEEKEKK